MVTQFNKALLVSLLMVSLNANGKEETEYSPFLQDNYPNQVYFGDTHLHTSYSTDAGLFGNTVGPDEAYRFAKGEIVTSSLGVKARLQRPLDFLVIADHAENLGLTPMTLKKDPSIVKNNWGKNFSETLLKGDLAKAYSLWGIQVAQGEDPFADNPNIQQSAWNVIIDAAEKHNQPGLFTAFIGFEWTSTPNGSNLHRNVIFRDGADKTSKVVPFSAYDSEDPEDLWKYMRDYEAQTGGKALAIAHNGNLSNGLMFDDVTMGGKPFSKDYAQRRMRAEPLYEVTQIKGDGEAHPLLSPRDEFADFGTWDKGSFQQPKQDGMIEKEYAREAYKRGLQFEKKFKANPFKFGVIGSTDSHTSLATTTEDNNFSKATPGEPVVGNVERLNQMVTGYLPDPGGRDYAIYHKSSLASGLAAVWARDNTREALWDAMARKEVYATTGTRLKVRVFVGWNFTQEDLHRPDFAKHAYANGVPMGGDITRKKSKGAPKFLIQAAKDPDWANLDRIQIIKGWIDKKGTHHERVYDVAVTGNRKIGTDGRCKEPVGNTVDIKSASFNNSIGAPVMQAYWQDPDFNKKQHAFYYVRVLEIPTPNWTVYDAKKLGLELPEDEPTSIQDRAYTSPIWYTP